MSSLVFCLHPSYPYLKPKRVGIQIPPAIPSKLSTCPFLSLPRSLGSSCAQVRVSLCPNLFSHAKVFWHLALYKTQSMMTKGFHSADQSIPLLSPWSSIFWIISCYFFMSMVLPERSFLTWGCRAEYLPVWLLSPACHNRNSFQNHTKDATKAAGYTLHDSLRREYF